LAQQRKLNQINARMLGVTQKYDAAIASLERRIKKIKKEGGDTELYEEKVKRLIDRRVREGH